MCFVCVCVRSVKTHLKRVYCCFRLKSTVMGCLQENIKSTIETLKKGNSPEWTSGIFLTCSPFESSVYRSIYALKQTHTAAYSVKRKSVTIQVVKCEICYIIEYKIIVFRLKPGFYFCFSSWHFHIGITEKKQWHTSWYCFSFRYFCSVVNVQRCVLHLRLTDWFKPILTS